MKIAIRSYPDFSIKSQAVLESDPALLENRIYILSKCNCSLMDYTRLHESNVDRLALELREPRERVLDIYSAVVRRLSDGATIIEFIPELAYREAKRDLQESKV